ncbi:MAG: hypothetical protein Kow0092_34290 [Deferrisomatales bacterium]
MKIRDPYTRSLAAAGKVRRRKKVDAASGVTTSVEVDHVQVSERSVEVQRARLLAIQAPDVREDLVEEISQAIARGEYRVYGADVVPKMLREHAEIASLA